MNNLKQECIELLMKNHGCVLKTTEDAVKAYDEISCIIKEAELKEFIKEDLCAFKTARKAWNWFNDEGREDILELLLAYDIKITQDMIGKDLHDVVLDSLLEDKENYIRVDENIHLTYWH